MIVHGDFHPENIFEPWDGCITIDGHDLRALKLKSLRQQISVVPQESMLFNRPIVENISYGNPEASLDQVIERGTHDELIKSSIRYRQYFELENALSMSPELAAE